MSKARERVLDEWLVVRCQEGSRSCFDLLVRRWQRRLWRYAQRLTGDADAAWDVMQDSWLAILRRIRSLNDPAWFAAWAYRIVRNRSADYCRRASRRRRAAKELAEQRRSAADTRGDEATEDVAAALQRLPQDLQELVMLKYGTDLNVLEIAVVLGIPAGTVKSRLHHARAELRRILTGEL